MKPVRVQRKRTKGWRMPANTVYVGRPTKWGNPYRVNECIDAQIATNSFRTNILSGGGGYLGDVFGIEQVQRELRGKNLACFCALDQPCHADVLLEIAND